MLSRCYRGWPSKATSWQHLFVSQEGFSAKLRRLRQQRFLSQAELARRAGLHKLTIGRLEAGKTAPYARTIRQLASVLGVPPEQLASPDEAAEAQRRS
jgi:transcriptional regulator with XRE-family HTH domain